MNALKMVATVRGAQGAFGATLVSELLPSIHATQRTFMLNSTPQMSARGKVAVGRPMKAAPTAMIVRR